MGYRRFAKKGTWLDDLSPEEIFEKIADYLLHSGFFDAWSGTSFQIDDLRREILRALYSNEIMPLEELEKMIDEAEAFEGSRLGAMLDEIIQKMVGQGYISIPDLDVSRGRVVLPGKARFEIADRGLDFLGFKSLERTLGRVGRDAFGRHQADRLTTGVEAGEAPKPYEFGDTINLDATATILAAVQRSGTVSPIQIETEDLMVNQSELTVPSATVVMLDCSHSMILYGEDRFTPAKRVALGLAHLIRTHYPGDELSLVLFHDSAEEVPMVRLPRVQIGPYHTNTAEGLRLSRRILSRSRHEVKRIVMITDGKPSAITLEDGQIYKNSFGLDPLILATTFDEVVACRKSGIVINTFMLARDRALIAFVKKMSAIARGRAFFTTPMTLGRYVTTDFMTGKTSTMH